MALSTWWYGDALPQIPELPGFHTAVSDNLDELSALTGLDADEVTSRLSAGHRAYVAYLDGVPVSYGWVATLSASIGELQIRFDLSAGDRYLWDFVTLPEWRGRGLYPRLLQAILRLEGSAAQRFWIIHAPENAASGAGIRKAGFEPVSDLSFLRDRSVAAVPYRSIERSRVGAAVLGVELVDALHSRRIVSPCWRCVIAASEGGDGRSPCWAEDGNSHECSCVPGRAA